jgi:hypothetical protein
MKQGRPAQFLGVTGGNRPCTFSISGGGASSEEGCSPSSAEPECSVEIARCSISVTKERNDTPARSTLMGFLYPQYSWTGS